MRKLLFTICLIFMSSVAIAQQRHNEIYINSTKGKEQKNAWSKITSGLHAGIGSIDKRYIQNELPSVESGKKWKGSAWKGERVSVQVILWSKNDISNIECQFSDFRSNNGKKIFAEAAQARFVKYVLTDQFGEEGCDAGRKERNYKPVLSADVLDNTRSANIKAETVLPVWITVDIPSDAETGLYTSTMTVFTNGKSTRKFTLSVEVLPQVLPPATDWKFHLDLWQNPYSVARIENVEPWSEAHWKALYPVMKMLADTGQKVITATLNKRPWNGQTEDAYDSMIGWTKRKDGSWSYDYIIFDRWVEFMMNLGINKQINCYSMVPWGNFIFYFDEKENKEIKVSVAPGTKEYEELWRPFLLDFYKHLNSKGWTEITRVAMDERAPEEMKAMLKFLNETAPNIGVALADNHKSYKLYPDQLMDLCVAHGATVDSVDRRYRKEKDYVTTWYVCCADKFPNVFTFSDPAEGAFIGWYTVAAEFDGFLRWAYNSWVKEPFVDSRFHTWPAGDTYIVYPGGRSSIRFERLREGIQDAEKIRILRNKLEYNNSKNSNEMLKQLNETVKKFNILNKPSDMEEMLKEGKVVLKKISKCV